MRPVPRALRQASCRVHACTTASGSATAVSSTSTPTGRRRAATAIAAPTRGVAQAEVEPGPAGVELRLAGGRRDEANPGWPAPDAGGEHHPERGPRHDPLTPHRRPAPAGHLELGGVSRAAHLSSDGPSRSTCHTSISWRSTQRLHPSFDPSEPTRRGEPRRGWVHRSP